MRPRRLEIKGLQSFKDVQRIDFDALGETGLFGIFGPTGSGKSTVLDAITLALYGNVQRAGRGTQGIVNTDMDEVEVSFTFDLLKEGIRRTYRVERVYRRRKGSDVSVENRLARLCEEANGGDLVIADKLGDVNRRVEDLIGLNSDDFTRSVVLPQNKFQEFLMLDGAKRREMLERIFYLEEYGQKLTEKLTARLNDVEKRLKKVEGAISSLGDASKEALEAAEGRLKEAASVKDKANGELKLVEQRLGTAKEVWELQAEMEAILREEEALLARQQEMEENRRLHRQAVKAKELEGVIVKYNELGGSLTDTIAQLETISIRMLDLERERQRVTELYNLKKEEAEKEIPTLIEQKSRLKDALVIEDEIAGIDKRLKELRGQYGELNTLAKEKDLHIKAVKEQLEKAAQALKDKKSKIEVLRVDAEYRKQVGMGVRLEEDLARLEEELREQGTRRGSTQTEITELEEELQRVSSQMTGVQERLKAEKARQAELESGQPHRREEIQREIEQFHRLQLKFQALKTASSVVDVLLKKHEDISLAEENQAKELANLQAAAEALLQNLESERRDLEGLRLEYEESMAFLLARELKENEACPVCGSTHHPKPAVRPTGKEALDVEQRFKEKQELVKKAEERYRDAQGRCLVLEEQRRGIQSQKGQIYEELEAAKENCRSILSGFPESMQELGIQGLEQELTGMEMKNEGRLKALKEWERDCSRINDAVQALSQEYSDIMVKYNIKKAELEVKRQGLESISQALETVSAALQGKRKEHEVLLSRLGIENALGEMKIIEGKDKQAQELQQEIEGLQHKEKQLRDDLERLTNEKHSLDSRLSVIETEGRGLKDQRNKEISRLTALTGGGDIKAALAAVEERLKELERQEKELQGSVKELERQHNELSHQKSALENQQRIFKLSLATEEERLKSGLKEKGFESIEQAVGALLADEDLQGLFEGIQRYDEQLKDINVQKKVCDKKLKGRTLSGEEWMEINEEYRIKKQQEELSISQYQEAKINFERLRDNHDRWTKLAGEQRELERKQDMLAQIQRLLRGNSFVEYISEERLRYIAREASETLAMLTKYRYALELDTAQGFVVRDNANGGVCRAVSTLSGGETFLTSLSLALALSKQIQLKGQSPLEFFFLDEGFGTLDSGLLDIVIDALERLSSRERVIGVISHVPELKNRIGRRLVVEPPSAFGHGSRVSIERA